MINCAHPAHVRDVPADGEPWVTRIRGLRSPASRLSHIVTACAPLFPHGA